MAEHRHKRETNARLKPRAITVAAPLALLATSGAVTIGVVSADPHPGSLLADGTSPRDAADLTRTAARVAPKAPKKEPARLAIAEQLKSHTRLDRAESLSRSAARDTERLWTTADLNLWTGPGADARQVGEVQEGEKIVATGRERQQRVEVVIDGQVRWVSDGYLSDEKPPPAPAGLSHDACPDPSVENGLTDAAVYVYRSVCHAFPQITSYGGWDAHGEHSSGKAIDIMTSDKALGDQIAEFLRAHAAELDLYDVIWWDRIWTPVRSSEGWRNYGDRGSATANHMDHVHVSVN